MVRTLRAISGAVAIADFAMAVSLTIPGTYAGDSPGSTVCLDPWCNVAMTAAWHDRVTVSNSNRTVVVSGNCRATTGSQYGPANVPYIKMSQRFVVRGYGLTGASLSIPGGWSFSVSNTAIEVNIPESGNSNQSSFQQNYSNITITGDADST